MAASIQAATVDTESMENNGKKFATEILPSVEQQETIIPEEGDLREEFPKKQKQSELAEELRLLSYCRLRLSLTDSEERKLNIILKERSLTREDVRQGWMWKRTKNTSNQIYATARGKNDSRARKCVSLLQDVSLEDVSVPTTKDTDGSGSASPSKQFHCDLTPSVKRITKKMVANKVDESEESRKIAPNSGTGSIVSTPTCSRSTSKQEVSEETCSKEDNEDNEVIYYTDMADSESLDSILGDIPLYPETDMATAKVATQDRGQVDVTSMISHSQLPRSGLRGHFVRMCCCLVPQSEEMATTGFQAPMELVPTSVLNDNYYITAESQASTEDMSTVLTAMDAE
ncbi:Hypp4370 [Branchiostoma lanceolatum]|uniref:Hypp4370 protein n=1 Tax=Branchiostoma lanceolatum TaxID=7740 RepID=A0A8K0A7A6_BRALA|nr:Hypp4370 [Branchiostoma lanceolatum]